MASQCGLTEIFLVDLGSLGFFCCVIGTLHTLGSKRQLWWRSTQITSWCMLGGALGAICSGNALGALWRGTSSLAWGWSGMGAYRLETSNGVRAFLVCFSVSAWTVEAAVLSMLQTCNHHRLSGYQRERRKEVNCLLLCSQVPCPLIKRIRASKLNLFLCPLPCSCDSGKKKKSHCDINWMCRKGQTC